MNYLSKIPSWTFTVVVVAAILYLTLVPSPLPQSDLKIPYFDKIAHVCMFGGLVFVATLDYARAAMPRDLSVPVMTVIAVCATLFGGFIELLQGWMGLGRGCDLMDFIADGAGAVVSAFVSMRLVGFMLRKGHQK